MRLLGRAEPCLWSPQIPPRKLPVPKGILCAGLGCVASPDVSRPPPAAYVASSLGAGTRALGHCGVQQRGVVVFDGGLGTQSCRLVKLNLCLHHLWQRLPRAGALGAGAASA